MIILHPFVLQYDKMNNIRNFHYFHHWLENKEWCNQHHKILKEENKNDVLRVLRQFHGYEHEYFTPICITIR